MPASPPQRHQRAPTAPASPAMGSVAASPRLQGGPGSPGKVASPGKMRHDAPEHQGPRSPVFAPYTIPNHQQQQQPRQPAQADPAPQTTPADASTNTAGAWRRPSRPSFSSDSRVPTGGLFLRGTGGGHGYGVEGSGVRTVPSSPTHGAGGVGFRPRTLSTPQDFRSLANGSANISTSSIPPGLGLQFLADDDAPLPSTRAHGEEEEGQESPYWNPLALSATTPTAPVGSRRGSTDIASIWNGNGEGAESPFAYANGGRPRSHSTTFHPASGDGVSGSRVNRAPSFSGPSSANSNGAFPSTTHRRGSDAPSWRSRPSPDFGLPQERTPQAAEPPLESEEEAQRRTRARSKSTSAAFQPRLGFGSPLHQQLHLSDTSPLSPTYHAPSTLSGTFGNFGHVANGANSRRTTHIRVEEEEEEEEGGEEGQARAGEGGDLVGYHSSPQGSLYTLPVPRPFERRRSSTQPHDTSIWGAESRSVQPSPRAQPIFGMGNGRRHTLATPLQQMATSLDSVSLHSEIDDYFQNTSRRASAWQEADRNLQLQQHRQAEDTPHTWPLYVVEFKAGRKDYFYLPRSLAQSLRIAVGDLVFVDADRGRDLGKVIHDRIFNKEQLDTYRSMHPDTLVDAHAKEITPQRIQKRATTADALPLLAKSEDEAKAVELCRLKIHQRQLPMQVVDAEYQWDRRKLTFYFISERRIDFRELVRELFKTYKTRIWMCAVHPPTPAMATAAAGAGMPSAHAPS